MEDDDRTGLAMALQFSSFSLTDNYLIVHTYSASSAFNYLLEEVLAREKVLHLVEEHEGYLCTALCSMC